MKFLLDTNIISEVMRPQPNPMVMKQLELNSIFSCTSATVWLELWHGIHSMQDSPRKESLAKYMSLLADDGFEVLPFCQESAEWLAKERVRLKAKGIIATKYDSEIAAVAVVNQLTLVTNNTKDFQVFDDLSLTSWHEG